MTGYHKSVAYRFLENDAALAVAPLFSSGPPVPLPGVALLSQSHLFIEVATLP